MDHFECDKCGECCRNIKDVEEYRNLDRGDGVCKYLNGNLCSIYSVRPLLCRIEDSYNSYFSSQMSKEEFYKQNYEACRILKTKLRRK